MVRWHYYYSAMRKQLARFFYFTCYVDALVQVPATTPDGEKTAIYSCIKETIKQYCQKPLCETECVHLKSAYDFLGVTLDYFLKQLFITSIGIFAIFVK